MVSSGGAARLVEAGVAGKATRAAPDLAVQQFGDDIEAKGVTGIHGSPDRRDADQAGAARSAGPRGRDPGSTPASARAAGPACSAGMTGRG